MRNISINGTEIMLKANETYYVIDVLYLNYIKEEIRNLGNNNFEKDLRERVFPFTDTPFAKILVKDVFKIECIKKVKSDEECINNSNCFSCDTGLIILVAERIFFNLVTIFDYEELVDSMVEDLNFRYWDRIINQYDPMDLGLILAPGIGHEFNGSGLYKILDPKSCL